MNTMEQPLEELISLPMPRLLGGNLCLDFVNGLDPRGGPHPRDFLTSYAALVSWGRHAAILTDEEARTLIRESQSHQAQADATLEQAVALRETMYRVFVAVARGQQAASDDLDSLRRSYIATFNHASLVPSDSGYEWIWNKHASDLDQMVWPVTRSAVELVTSEQLGRVKECARDGCGWLFLDMSKNGSRRWCSMEGCGSRDKMRRQYARKRAQ